MPPPVEAADLEQLEAGLERYRGSGQLVNFWAIWCKPCVAELPELEHVAKEYYDRGGRVVAVSYDLMVPGVEHAPTLERVEKFWAANQYTPPVFVYDGDDYDSINARFGLPGEVPVTLAIDAEGNIVDRQHGPADEARFRELMEAALR